MKGILPEVRVSRMGIRKKMLLMYVAVIFTMTVVIAGIFMWMNKRYAEMLYQETTDSLFLISNEMKLYLDGIEADSYYMVADASLQSNLSAYQSTADGWQKRKLRNQIESSVYNYAVGNKYIRSVTLITPEFSVCRGSSSVQESEAYLEQLKQQANEENGKAFWAVSQEDPSTILMVRSYREIHNLSLKTMGYQVQSGRGFVQKDYDSYRKVALVDSYAAQNIFGSESPVGKTIEVGSEPYIIVGVITQSEDNMPKINTLSEYEEYSQTIMGSVMIPDTTWPVAFKFDQPQNVTVRADSTDNMSSVGKAAEDILNTGIQNEKNKSNFKYKAEDIMEKVKNLQKLSESTNQQLIWIASISLLVGGIGVMNIMLVSVTERTSEIGLKKAIGARKKVILGQFLTEASVLTSIGGIIGVILGIILSKVVAQVSGAPTAISVPAIIGSVVFSMLIGLIFGLLPSVKAANLNPIDALRSE